MTCQKIVCELYLPVTFNNGQIVCYIGKVSGIPNIVSGNTGATHVLPLNTPRTVNGYTYTVSQVSDAKITLEICDPVELPPVIVPVMSLTIDKVEWLAGSANNQQVFFTVVSDIPGLYDLITKIDGTAVGPGIFGCVQPAGSKSNAIILYDPGSDARFDPYNSHTICVDLTNVRR